MRVLVTGSEGMVGTEVQTLLAANGHAVVGYDLLHGQSILDMNTLTKAASGCDAIIHLAVSENQVSESEEMQINLLGTWNVLLAAEAAHVSRVIYISSVDALGIFQGEGIPSICRLMMRIRPSHAQLTRLPSGSPRKCASSGAAVPESRSCVCALRVYGQLQPT